MTDPTSANKVLVALAERALKRRRSQLKKEEPKEIVLEETQSFQEENFQPEKKSNFRPKKNSNKSQSIKEEFPPPSESEEYSNEFIDSEEYENISIKNPRRVLNYSPENNIESNVPVRKSRKNPKLISRVKKFNPENAETFEEQVDLVGNLLCDKLSAFQSIPALRITQDWIDCIVDENDSLYEEVYKKLMLLNKEQLMGYIRILVSALR